MTIGNVYKDMSKLLLWAMTASAVALAPVLTEAQSSTRLALPSPTGPLRVGRVSVNWADAARIEPLSPTHAYRELMVDVWYPADASEGQAADYLDAATFQRVLGIAGFQRQFGEASDVLKSGLVQTHAIVAAPFARGAMRCPVLIFSPGGGMVREVYTAQIEDLVSHGYVVAAITHPYDGIVAAFPDGHTITYDNKRWPQIPSLAGELNLNQLEWHARDITFVLDELSKADRTTASPLPFSGHLDLSRVGAFGHSFGGTAAAHACQMDRRIKACLNQDGVAARKPFSLDARVWGMDQAFMLIERAPDRAPSDQELAAMKLTRPQANDLVARLQSDHDAALRRTGRGSYDVILDNTKTTHMDFSDLPFLGARTPSEAAVRARIVAVVRSWTLAFFDETLRSQKVPLLSSQSAREFVETVQQFAPAKRAW